MATSSRTVTRPADGAAANARYGEARLIPASRRKIETQAVLQVWASIRYLFAPV
jgi:hypothetical protein